MFSALNEPAGEEASVKEDPSVMKRLYYYLEQDGA